MNTEERVTVFLTSHDAGDIEQVCRRAIVINHGEIILDAPVATLKRDYLKAKTVDLLLNEPVETLLTSESTSNQQHLNIELPYDTGGIRILKAKGRELTLEIDTARCPLEPVVAAIMERSHIIDMTITDPPMEEIIAAIYSEKIGDREPVIEQDATIAAMGE